MAKYRVGMIGGGRKGTQHARAYALNPLTEVVAIADTDAENLELFCGRFKVPGYSDYKEMLQKEKIDIAAPILPVGPNPAVVLGCAAAGVRAILCEKPISATLEDADLMVQACQSRGIKFGAGDMDRNLPPYWTAREIVESGELGEVQSISFTGGSGSEMSGGGCQQFSLMRMFAEDADVAWVIGWVTDDAASDHDQGGAGYIRFVNGIEGFIHRQPDARGAGFEVLCSRGTFRSSNGFVTLWKAEDGVDRPTWAELKPVKGVLPETNVFGRRSSEYDDDGWRWPGDRNVASVQSIVDALEMDIEPRSSGDNGRKVLEMAIAIRESHRRGHAPVQLPLTDRNLRLFAKNWRMENKKPIFGREKYMAQVAGHKRD